MQMCMSTCSAKPSPFVTFYLFVNPENPGFDIGIMIMGNVVNCENWSVFFRMPSFWPKRRITLLKKKLFNKLI